MNNSSDSSFSFHQRVKRQREFKLPLPLQKKPRRSTIQKAVLHIRNLGLPLISRLNGQFCDSICLKPHEPCTIGRKLKLCDFVFTDRRVSKRHCQLFFDSSKNKIYLSDGLYTDYWERDDSFSSVRTRVSLNGAYVNGVRISEIVELRVGDVVWLVCGDQEACSLGDTIGFLVEKIVFMEEIDYRSVNKLNSCGLRVGNSHFSLEHSVSDSVNELLSFCRGILCSYDPVSYICKDVGHGKRKSIDFSLGNDCMKTLRALSNNRFRSCSNCTIQVECRNRKRVYSRESDAAKECDGQPPKEAAVVSEENIVLKSFNVVPVNCVGIESKTDGGGVDIGDGAIASCNSAGLLSVKRDTDEFREGLEGKSCDGYIQPPGKKFYLNRLQFGSQLAEEIDVVSLPELFHPIENLTRVFIATFTSDIAWFLSYCKIPPHLPVTIACHSAERCWSSESDNRFSVPFSVFPNLTVVYPLFPEVIAFNKERKNTGIACHHPKLLVLLREESLRVVITSANLVPKQWHQVTNTVWWQDFPRLRNPSGLSLFTQLSIGEVNMHSNCDFAAQLAGFMASLIADVPSQAHWILELAKYDFSGAIGYLVASVPGIHSLRNACVSESKNHLAGNKYQVDTYGAKFLASVEESVVGLSHIYRSSADSKGAQLKRLAMFLRKCQQNVDGMSEVVLTRVTNIPADGNAVSVHVPNPEYKSTGDYVQLGFLPRHVAKWVAPLSDAGVFAFSAYIHPKEVLTTVLEGSNNKVKLILYVYVGPSFSDILEITQVEHVSAICSLVASSQRYAGLWRLKEVLDQYKWPEHLESEFFFGASSIGAVNSQFIAAFSAAAGKRSVTVSDSEESDPDWGCWSASQELKSPSVGIVFPSIKRVKSNKNGIMASRCLLCFSQKTWQSLKNVGRLHDAIPHPRHRVGFPMHVKVGRRRFQSKKDGSSFGWVYSGSHNFSAAAWGRPISDRQTNGDRRSNSVLGSRLHISNYELGIVFIVPPPDAVDRVEKSTGNLDDIVLPFVVPPPKYRPEDRPATAQAMREAMNEMAARERQVNETVVIAGSDWVEGEVPEEEEEEVLEAAQYLKQEKEDEKVYADQLWNQVDSAES